MARLVQDTLKRPLAEELLFGRLAQGGHVRVTVKAGEFHMDIEPATPKLPAPAHTGEEDE